MTNNQTQKWINRFPLDTLGGESLRQFVELIEDIERQAYQQGREEVAREIHEKLVKHYSIIDPKSEFKHVPVVIVEQFIKPTE